MKATGDSPRGLSQDGPAHGLVTQEAGGRLGVCLEGANPALAIGKVREMMVRRAP
jgi:hypothetical protein